AIRQYTRQFHKKDSLLGCAQCWIKSLQPSEGWKARIPKDRCEVDWGKDSESTGKDGDTETPRYVGEIDPKLDLLLATRERDIVHNLIDPRAARLGQERAA